MMAETYDDRALAEQAAREREQFVDAQIEQLANTDEELNGTPVDGNDSDIRRRYGGYLNVYEIQRIQAQGLVLESTANGKIEQPSRWLQSMETCDSCSGTGSVDNLPCYTCKGAGMISTWACSTCKRRTQHEGNRECEC